jgi:hypothetical protein
MTPYFAMVAICGYFSCPTPYEVKFDNRDACVQFVKNWENGTNEIRGSGVGVTCFDRIEGKIVYDLQGRK